MNKTINHYSPRKNHGVAVLSFSVFLLMIITFITLSANRSTFIEQKSVTNEYRNMQATAAASAGLEQFIATLNANISGAYTPGTGLNRFSNQVADNLDTDDFLALVSTGTISSTLNGNQAFRVFVSKQTATPNLYRIMSIGCSDVDDVNNCTPQAESINFAMQDIILSPGASGPASIFKVQSDIKVDGSGYQSNGNLRPVHVSMAHDVDVPLPVSFGGTTSSNGTAFTSTDYINAEKLKVDGTKDPAHSESNGIEKKDYSDTDKFFKDSHDGKSTAEVKTKAGTDGCLISKATVTFDEVNAISAKCSGKDIWVEGKLTAIGSGTIGTLAVPVKLNVEGSFEIWGAATINGSMYTKAAAGSSDFTAGMTGSLAVNGTLTSEGNFHMRPYIDANGVNYGTGGSLNIHATKDMLDKLGLTGGGTPTLARMRYTWRDF